MTILPYLPPNSETTPAGELGDPDFTGYPWPGIIRAIYWSYRLNLPHLRGLILQTIERSARRMAA